MALADDQKQRILYHLCLPALSIVENSTHYNSIYNDRLSDIDSTIQTIVEEILECIEEAETALKDAKKCLKVQSVDGITINTDHLKNLKYEYHRLAKKLACTLDLPMGNRGSMVGICV